MEKFEISINLRFVDKGYGITEFSQTADLGDGTLEFVVKSLHKDASERANKIAERGWAWVSGHLDEIKDYLSAGLEKECEEMRRNKEKHIPPDDTVMIREQLRELNPSGCGRANGLFALPRAVRRRLRKIPA
jgi:hypothetical protein